MNVLECAVYKILMFTAAVTVKLLLTIRESKLITKMI